MQFIVFCDKMPAKLAGMNGKLRCHSITYIPVIETFQVGRPLWGGFESAAGTRQFESEHGMPAGDKERG
jgi:hypothetical protein